MMIPRAQAGIKKGSKVATYIMVTKNGAGPATLTFIARGQRDEGLADVW